MAHIREEFGFGDVGRLGLGFLEVILFRKSRQLLRLDSSVCRDFIRSATLAVSRRSESSRLSSWRLSAVMSAPTET